MLWNAADSEFGAAFLSALAGAFAGVIGAERVAYRAKRRDDLIAEVRHANTAIALACAAANALFNVKEQSTAPLVRKFRANVLLRESVEAASAAGTPLPGPHHLHLDLSSFPQPVIPLEPLRALVFERLSAPARALSALSSLDQVLDALKDLIVRRETIARSFQQMDEKEALARYFGTPLEGGSVDHQYPDALLGIERYVDDAIFFSMILCEDLIRHARKQTAELRSGVGIRQEVLDVSFEEPTRKGLVPEKSKYGGWLAGFRERDKHSKRWFAALGAKLGVRSRPSRRGGN
jgi:hypothetical protein